MNSYPKNRLAEAVSLVAGAFALCAFHANASTLEEVTVTAQKREQSLQDVPLAVQAMDADSLKQNGVVSLSDIGNIAPGVKIANLQGVSNTTAIRGVSSYPFGFGLEESVPYYLDGIYLGNGFAMLGDLVDVEQIEVLKGPQGTLFGRNASGGAINVRTRRPGNALESSVSAGAGSYGLRTARGTLNLPLIDDKLLLRAGFSNRDSDGWQTNVMTGKEDGFAQDRWAAFAKLLWLPSDTLEVAFTGDWSSQDDHSGYKSVGDVRPSALWQGVYTQADAESFYDETDRDAAAGNDGFAIALPDGTGGLITIPIAPAENVPLAQQRDIRGNALTVSWDLGDNTTLTSLSSYRRVDSLKGSDADGSSLGLSHSYSEGSTEEYNQELRLNVVGEQLDWFVGANAYRQDRDNRFVVTTSGLVPLSRLGLAGLAVGGLTEVSAGFNKTESYAAFGDAIWHLSDRVNLTGGLRYSRDTKSYRLVDAGNDTWNGQGILFPNPDQLANPDHASLRDSWSNLSGRLVLDYQFDNGAMAYASFSQGYKSGGYNTTLSVEGNPMSGFTTPEHAAEPFDEESNDNLELGLKTSLLGGRMQLNSSLFHYVYKDLQFLLSDVSSPVARTVNAAEVTGRGWEGDVTFLATDNLSLFANFSMLDVEYSEDVVDAAGVVRYEKGTERPWSPRFSGLLGIDHEIAVGELGRLRSNLTYSYTGEHYLRGVSVAEDVDPQANKQDAYGIFNGRLSFYSAGEAWEFALWGKNLLDERYRGLTDGSTLVTAGNLAVLYGQPRTFGAEVAYSF